MSQSTSLRCVLPEKGCTSHKSGFTSYTLTGGKKHCKSRDTDRWQASFSATQWHLHTRRCSSHVCPAPQHRLPSFGTIARRDPRPLPSSPSAERELKRKNYNQKRKCRQKHVEMVASSSPARDAARNKRVRGSSSRRRVSAITRQESSLSSEAAESMTSVSAAPSASASSSVGSQRDDSTDDKKR